MCSHNNYCKYMSLFERRLPSGPRRIPSAYVSQVPDAIAAFVEMQLSGAAMSGDSFTGAIKADMDRAEIEKHLSIIHLPRRKTYQAAVLRRRVSMSEVRIDYTTSRFYLVGSGARGREERTLEERPVQDESDRIASQLFTASDIRNDMVIAYTEITRNEYLAAPETVENITQMGQQGLCSFFQIPPTHLSGLVLALPEYSTEEIEAIGRYALREKGVHSGRMPRR